MMALLGLVGLASFAATSTPVLLPAITSDLGSLGLAPWIVTSFLLTSTVAMLVAGQGFDAVGARRAFRGTCLLFATSSLACALAPSIGALVAARTVQGGAAGLSLTISAASIGLVVPDRLRGRAFAASSAAWGLLAVASPLSAAVVEPALGWRGVFGLNAASAILIGGIGWRLLPAAVPMRPAVRFDGVGFVLLAALTVVLTLGAAEFGLVAVVCVGGAVALGGMYWRHSTRCGAPVFSRSVLVGWPFGLVHLIALSAFSVSALNGYLPFYVRITLGEGATASAIVAGSMSVGWTAAMFVVARLLDHRSEVDIAVLGYAVLGPAVIVLTVEFAFRLGLPVLVAGMVMVGLGVGSVSAAMLVKLQATATATTMGQTTAAHQFTRSIGYTMSTALVGALVVASASTALSAEDLRDVLDGAPARGGDVAADAVGRGFRWTAALMLAVLLPGAVAAVQLRRGPASNRRSRTARKVPTADPVSGRAGRERSR